MKAIQQSCEAKFVWLAQVPFTKEAVTAFVDKRLVRSLTVVSDWLARFSVTAKFSIHEHILVSAGRASAAYARFNAVSTAQSNLKTAISGTYHSTKFGMYVHRHVAEFQCRFNCRFDMQAIFARQACIACGSPPQNHSSFGLVRLIANWEFI